MVGITAMKREDGVEGRFRAFYEGSSYIQNVDK